uniref:Conodipine 4 n=1 Tax=Conus geographus TaxID=6491 RepID=W4VSC8_CONGE
MKMLAPVLWAMVALGVTLLMDVDSASAQSCTTYSNGCSTPVPVPCREFFRTACDKHDSCYHCGKTFGISRWECDVAFLIDMNELCGNLLFSGYIDTCTSRRKRQVASDRATSIARSTPWKKALHQKSFLNREARIFPLPLTTCRDWATTYYSAVRLGAASHYSETVRETDCEAIRPCLPDN